MSINQSVQVWAMLTKHSRTSSVLHKNVLLMTFTLLLWNFSQLRQVVWINLNSRMIIPSSFSVRVMEGSMPQPSDKEFSEKPKTIMDQSKDWKVLLLETVLLIQELFSVKSVSMLTTSVWWTTNKDQLLSKLS